MQTDVAQLLNMPRGTYAEISGRKRLSAREYKEHKKREEKELNIMKTVSGTEFLKEKLKYQKQIKELKEKLSKYENKQPIIKDEPINLTV